MIMERKFQPVIVFSFSKKECEAYALQMSKLDFNTGANLNKTCAFCLNYISSLTSFPSQEKRRNWWRKYSVMPSIACQMKTRNYLRYCTESCSMSSDLLSIAHTVTRATVLQISISHVFNECLS